MDLLEVVKEILEGKKHAPIMADWLEDNRADHPECARYCKLLRLPGVRMQTLIDTIAKFGVKKQRSLVMKIMRNAMRSRDRWHAKGTIRAYMKKSWSMRHKWYMVDNLNRVLGTGPAPSPPSSEES